MKFNFFLAALGLFIAGGCQKSGSDPAPASNATNPDTAQVAGSTSGGGAPVISGQTGTGSQTTVTESLKSTPTPIPTTAPVAVFTHIPFDSDRISNEEYLAFEKCTKPEEISKLVGTSAEIRDAIGVIRLKEIETCISTQLPGKDLHELSDRLQNSESGKKLLPAEKIQIATKYVLSYRSRQAKCTDMQASASMVKAAQNFAEDMAKNQALSSKNSAGQVLDQRLKAEGLTFSASGETIGYTPSPEMVMIIWIKTPSLKLTLDNCAFDSFGIGYSDPIGYWAADFAKTK